MIDNSKTPDGRLLADSWLAEGMSEDELAQLAALGEIVFIPGGQPLFRENDDSQHLYVVLEGLLLPDGDTAFWRGPGDICGEVGFVLGLPRTRGLVAFGFGARLWRVDRCLITDPTGPATTALVTRLIIALARGLQVRLDAARQSSDPVDLPDYCDHTHPAIMQFARHFKRAADFDTAIAVWRFVRLLPYRFGPWQVRASSTLRQGYGMCTTKANLQVALMRALGHEAGFVETHIPGEFMRALMPPTYHLRFQRPSFKHYFAAVRVDGTWIPLEASFTDPLMRLADHGAPGFIAGIDWDPKEHGHANAMAMYHRTDPLDFEVRPDLAAEMRKQASYDLGNATAMNVVLDRIQGFVHNTPSYAGRAIMLLDSGLAAQALAVALAGLSVDVADLRAVYSR